MRFLIILALVGASYAAVDTKGKYVFDLLKPALTSAEVLTILASKDANSYPTYDTIPATSFQCSSKAQPGFYADVDTQCQVFHRCDQSSNQTDYICVNGTIFNQITLICDAWFNVDCSKSLDYENFANSRLYTDQPLFDTPPADYVAPSQSAALAAMAASQGGAAPVVAAKPTPVKPGARVPAKPAAKPAAKPGAAVKPAASASASASGANVAAAGRADINADSGAVQVTSPDDTAAPVAAADPTAGQRRRRFVRSYVR